MRLLMMNILLSVDYGELETRIYSLTECENVTKLSWAAPDTTQLGEAGGGQDQTDAHFIYHIYR